MRYPNLESENNKKLIEMFQNMPFEIWENWDDGDGLPSTSDRSKKVEDKVGLVSAMNSLASNNNCRDTHEQMRMHYNCYGPGGIFYMNEQGEIIIPYQSKEKDSSN